jgi:hypothetical protein
VTRISLRLLDVSLYTFFAENVATIGHLNGCVFAAEPVVTSIADNVFVSVVVDRSAARSVTVGVTAVGGSRSQGIHQRVPDNRIGGKTQSSDETQ